MPAHIFARSLVFCRHHDIGAVLLKQVRHFRHDARDVDVCLRRRVQLCYADVLWQQAATSAAHAVAHTSRRHDATPRRSCHAVLPRHDDATRCY